MPYSNIDCKLINLFNSNRSPHKYMKNNTKYMYIKKIVVDVHAECLFFTQRRNVKFSIQVGSFTMNWRLGHVMDILIGNFTPDRIQNSKNVAKQWWTSECGIKNRINKFVSFKIGKLEIFDAMRSNPMHSHLSSSSWNPNKSIP